MRAYTGLEAKPVSATEKARISEKLGKQAALYDLSEELVAAAPRQGGTITGVPAEMQGIPILVAFRAATARPSGTVQLIHESLDHRVLGGNTFALRDVKANARQLSSVETKKKLILIVRIGGLEGPAGGRFETIAHLRRRSKRSGSDQKGTVTVAGDCPKLPAEPWRACVDPD